MRKEVSLSFTSVMASCGLKRSAGGDISDSDADSDSNSDSGLKSKSTAKKTAVKRACVYKSEFTDRWPCLKQGKKGDSFVLCTTCVTEFSVKSGGSRDDSRRHIESEKHCRPKERLPQISSGVKGVNCI